jgi:formylglycine-generating enzyme required for sulfatase activity
MLQPIARIAILLSALLGFAPTAKQGLQSYEETLPGSVVKLKMLAIPGGEVTLNGKKIAVKPFYLASTETPWEAFDVFLKSGPPSKPYDQTKFAPDAIARPSKSYILPDLGWGHHGYPTINVSITNVTMFCRWLAKETGKKYRLPTEAEWEFACREGLDTGWSPPSDLNQVAWFAGNSRDTTHPVAKKAPNKFGLYDMLGNVGEWAIGLDGEPVLCGSAYKDPANQTGPTLRRKWSPKWQETDPQIPKSRWWLSDGDFVGFRLVCEP